MYDDLVKKIRHCATDPMHCLSCGEVKDGRCFKRLMTQAADAIEQLSNAGSAYGRGWTLGYDAGREESKPRWIPVTERLPEEYVNVLIFLHSLDWNSIYYSIDHLMEDGQWWKASTSWKHEVTHWMPLPEAPKNSLEKVDGLAKKSLEKVATYHENSLEKVEPPKEE